MIRILYRTADGRLRTDLTREELPSALADKTGLLWVDFEGEPPEVCQPLLTDVFGFHPLAVDDALVEMHVPKVDDWGSYLYIALHAVHIDLNGGNPLDTHELDFFLGEHYLVSHHDEPVAAVNRVLGSVPARPAAHRVGRRPCDVPDCRRAGRRLHAGL